MITRNGGPKSHMLLHNIYMDAIQLISSSAGANGNITFTGLQAGSFLLRVIAIDIVSGDKAVIRSRVWISGDNQFCTVYPINRRVTVFGNSATVEFSNTGTPTSFSCSLDRQLYSTCEFKCSTARSIARSM